MTSILPLQQLSEKSKKDLAICFHPNNVMLPSTTTKTRWYELHYFVAALNRFTNCVQALNAAVASHEHLDVLKDELTSQSVSFKKLVIKEVVRQDKSDDFIRGQILTAPRAVRKQLIGKCIKFRRVALLESLIPEILKLHGADEVASFLHGCSDKVVKEHLTQGDLIHNKNLNWAHLARYHGALIVSLMEAELSTSSVWNRAGVFENWEDLLSSK